MDNPKSLTDHAYLFIQGEISEEDYVNKHPKNSKKFHGKKLLLFSEIKLWHTST